MLFVEEKREGIEGSYVFVLFFHMKDFAQSNIECELDSSQVLRLDWAWCDVEGLA